MTYRRLAIGFVLCLPLLVPTETARGQAIVEYATLSAKTTGLVHAFVTAYNAHNLRAVMSFTGSHVRWTDCDFASHQLHVASGRQHVTSWFKHMFALHDHLRVSSVVTGGLNMAKVGLLPYAFGLTGTRTNKLLKSPQPLDGSKGKLNSQATRLREFTVSSQAGCERP